MKIIFLDVDGVLNYQGSTALVDNNMYFVSDDKLNVLQNLVKETGAELVLSSSWRRGWSLSIEESNYKRDDLEVSKYYFMLCAKLHQYGLSFLSEIPRLPSGNRQEAIEYWLSEWPGEKIDGYVIIDDEAKKFSEGNKHLIVTSDEYGLMPRHIDEAKRILKVKGKKKVLVVDDVEIGRAVIREVLESEYDIVEALDGKEAISILENNPDFDVVITDIQMPNINGIELIERIRNNHKYDHIAIIANTQYGEMEQEEEIIELGADDFVYKPLSPKMIKLRLANVLIVREKKQ